MRLYQSAEINTSALTVAGLYLIVNPPPIYINGAPYGILGLVGTSSWGPINQAVTVGSLSEYVANFGPIGSGATDLGVNSSVAMRTGVSSMSVVRVVGAGAKAASGSGSSGGLAATAAYEGSAGNGISVSVAQSSTGFTLTTAHATLGGASYTGSTWQQIADALALDEMALVAITATDMTAAPTVNASFTLSGGSDGAPPATGDLLGADQGADSPGTGMYALRRSGASQAVICGLADPTSWGAQATFGASEAIYMVVSGPSGDTVANAITAKASANAANPWLKVMMGDWVYTIDPTNGNMMLPPSIFVAALLASRSPNYPALNAQIGIVNGTQRSRKGSGQAGAYSYAEIQALVAAGIDVIGSPSPGGNYFSCLTGHNSSPVAVLQSDTYPQMTDYIATSLYNGMGVFIGQPVTPSYLREIDTTICSYLSALVSAGLLSNDSVGNPPFSVVCDSTNNPDSQVALGYVRADVKVRYQGINEKFVVNLQGGSSVTIATGS